MLSQIEALDPVDEHDDEWMTTEQWCAFWRVGRRKAHSLIRRAIKSGKMEVKRLTVRRADGERQSYPHYRWIG